MNDDQKRQLIEARLQQFAVEKFGHEINRQVAVTTDDTDAVAAADASITTLDAVIAVYQTELEALPAVEPNPDIVGNQGSTGSAGSTGAQGAA